MPSRIKRNITAGYTTSKKSGRKGKVIITFPPVLESFDLPAKDHILTVKAGDFVKVLFEYKGQTERMWVIIDRDKDRDPHMWHGILDNNPAFLPAAAGDGVFFHPLAIIDIMRANEIAPVLARIDQGRA
jgi:hypothetical protein